MIEKLSLKLLGFVRRYLSMDNELAEVYKYGIEISISTTLNVFITMIIALVLGDPLCGITFLGCIVVLRSYCGGYHADSYLKCNCLMVMLFAITYLASRAFIYFDIAKFHIMSSVLLLSFIPIYAFSPVKNTHKVLSEKKAKKCRIVSIILYITFGFGGLFLISVNSFYGSIMIVTLTEVSVMIIIEILRQRREKHEVQGNGG